MKTRIVQLIILIPVLICLHLGCAKTVKVRTHGDQAAIGTLKWEIHEVASRKRIASGDGPVYLKDVSLAQLSGRPTRMINKCIRLTREFEIAMAESPSAASGEKVGFGIVARRSDIPSFSWEWFNLDGNHRAVKLQEWGELGIDMKKVGDAWEITRTEFKTDIPLCIIRSGLDTPTSPYWRINILKGSTITWPSLVDGKIVPHH